MHNTESLRHTSGAA